ncbi:hypothetical protein [Streptomyces luteogriseus]|uniref:hypothetical protein n=1 Tax=Streptomyces luteogriseus TaxID=68233 RepID=UPI003808F6B8
MSEFTAPAEDAQRSTYALGGPDPGPGLVPCPRCTEAVVDLDEHLAHCKEPDTEPESLADRLAAAHALIEENRQDRMKACLADIEAVLARHGMALHIEPARLTLVPKD